MIITLQGTNISPQNGILKMIFLFPRWDMLIPWRVHIIELLMIFWRWAIWNASTKRRWWTQNVTKVASTSWTSLLDWLSVSGYGFRGKATPGRVGTPQLSFVVVFLPGSCPGFKGLAVFAHDYVCNSMLIWLYNRSHLQHCQHLQIFL